MKIKYLYEALILSSLVFYAGTIVGNTLEQQRQNFLLAEKMIEQGDDKGFSFLASSLSEYPLYPYLQYQWLKNNLSKTDRILAYMSTYSNTRYADLLRTKWLDYLADNERWAEFIQFYQDNDDGALECQFYWAQYKVGDQKLALTEAKRLWLVGETQPKECDSLLSVFMQSPLFTHDLIWDRFELAMEKNNTALARYLQHLLDKPYQYVAAVWLRVHENPKLIDGSMLAGSNARHGVIFAYGVQRLAYSDINYAIKIWDSNRENFALKHETVQKTERKLALALAYAHDGKAYQRLNQLVRVDKEVRDWKFRAALLEQNWQHVASTLNDLPINERAESKWQYWLARSLVETGNVQEGQKIFSSLSADRSFYGFMAADVMNKAYSFADKPVDFAENALESLTQQADFKVVKEFINLGLEAEAKRQWWFIVKALPREQLLIAAKLAQKWQWDQVAIITLVKADYWDDLGLRFPLKYVSQVQSYADWQDLDPAFILGLIRQESMLDYNARSEVGARGLMQIMPETAQQIARNLREAWHTENVLSNPDVNIKYGSYYFKQLLNKFDGHFVLAAAAYNAGPHRVSKWLPKNRSLPADIWIETIPFNETRKYVISVLSYVIIYQQLIKRDALKITRLLSDVRS